MADSETSHGFRPPFPAPLGLAAFALTTFVLSAHNAGWAPDVVVGPGGGGYLVLKRPWPAMLRGIHNDHERYVETYWSRFPGMYFAGDGARIDEEGDFWLMGRVDDVMNVSAHRIRRSRSRAPSSTIAWSQRQPCAAAPTRRRGRQSSPT